MGFFPSSGEEDKSVEELDQDLKEKERKIKKKQGERRLEEMKQQKKKELKQKDKQLKKEEFKQSKAGKIINTLGNELGKLAEASDSKRAAELSQAAEKVDGDSKGDTSAALGIGLEKQDRAKDIEIKGDLQVEGDIVTENNQRSNSEEGSIPLFDEEDEGGIL